MDLAETMIGIVKRLGIFTIAAQTLLHFCPNQKYEKYIKVLIGSMTIVILMVPVLGLFQSGVEEDIWNRIESYGTNMEKILEENGMLEEVTRGRTQEDTLQDAETVKEEITLKINEITKEKGYLIHEIAWREENSGVSLTLYLKKKQSIRIEKVTVGETTHSATELELETLLSEKLGIEKGRLEVILDE